MENFIFFHKITPFAPQSYVYPAHDLYQFLNKQKDYGRFWTYGSAAIPVNNNILFGVYSPDGFDSLHIKNYAHFISSSQDGNVYPDKARQEAYIAGGYGESELKQNFFRKRVMDLVGVKYILHSSSNKSEAEVNTFPKDQYKLKWFDNNYQIYENKNSLPRAFFVSNYIVRQGEKDTIKNLLDPDFDIHKSVILEEKLPIRLSHDPRSLVKILSYDTQKIELLTKSKTRQLLVFLDNNYSDWRLEIDGKSDKIYMVNGMFRGIITPPGEHKIVMYYRSDEFILGVAISITIILFLLFFYFLKRHIKN
jgi:hypothetical protein